MFLAAGVEGKSPDLAFNFSLGSLRPVVFWASRGKMSDTVVCTQFGGKFFQVVAKGKGRLTSLLGVNDGSGVEIEGLLGFQG